MSFGRFWISKPRPEIIQISLDKLIPADNHDPLFVIFMNLFRVKKIFIFSITFSSQPANINDRLNESGSLLGTEPLVLLVLVTRSHHLDHLKT